MHILGREYLVRYLVCFCVILGAGVVIGGLIGNESAFAAASITLNVSASVSTDVLPGSAASSATGSATISVKTNNSTGYRLAIAASSGNTAGVNVPLINVDSNCTGVCTIPSIASNSEYSSPSDFDANTWGYMASKYNSSTSNWDNLTNYYQPGPTTVGNDLDTTSTANADTFNNYNIALGAKVDTNTPPGTYENTFVILAIANPLTYSVNYTNASGVTGVSNMPANISNTITAEGENTFTISSTTPTRTGYNFNKWCTVSPTTSAGVDSCTGGTEYAAGATYTLDPTTNPQTVTLYAMWNLASYTVTVNFAGSGVSSATLSNTTYGGGGTVSTSGGTVSLKHGVSYNISGSYASGYEFSSWGTAANGTLGSTSSASTTYTVTNTSTLTLTVTSCQTTVSGYMQNFKPCRSVANGTTGTLTDSRDNQSYHVGKLADGKWWLLDNLALDLTNSTVRNGMNQTNTNASNTTLSYLKNGGGTTSDKYATAGVANWTSGYSYSAPLVNLTNKDVVPTDTTSTAGGYKVGGYYNYCAASAGSYCYGNGTSEGTSSGDATEDICPKGWRMPTGNTSGEYQRLYGNSSYNTYANFRAALRLPLSGYFTNGSASRQGSYGYFWSSSRRDNTNMHDVRLRTSSMSPAYDDYRYNGNPIRCLLSS